MLKIIVPFYGQLNLLLECIDSIQAQSFNNFICILADDCTPDKVPGGIEIIVRTKIMNDDRFIYSRSETNVKQGLNIHRCVNSEYIQPNDRVVVIDGDDKLICTGALQFIQDAFKEGALVVNSQMVNQSDGYVHKRPIDLTAIRSDEGWGSVHPRCFRADLWQRNVQADEFIDDETGEGYKYALDRIFWVRILESIHPSLYTHIPRVFYLYRDNTGQNEHSNMEAQLKVIEKLNKVNTKPIYTVGL